MDQCYAEDSLEKVTLRLGWILTELSDATHMCGLFGSNLFNFDCMLELPGEFLKFTDVWATPEANLIKISRDKARY